MIHQRERDLNRRLRGLAQFPGDSLTDELADRLFVHHSESL
jgi:hypothetical protein